MENTNLYEENPILRGIFLKTPLCYLPCRVFSLLMITSTVSLKQNRWRLSPYLAYRSF